MKEIDCQSLVIDAVRGHGGAAHKLSNRFLVGVSDLLVKLPDRPAALLEVKLNKFSANISEGHAFLLDLTKLQDKFLHDYRAAGMLTGIMSFVETRGKGIQSLRLCVFSLDSAALGCWYRRGDHALLGDHRTLGGPKGRHVCIIQDLEEFAK